MRLMWNLLMFLMYVLLGLIAIGMFAGMGWRMLP